MNIFRELGIREGRDRVNEEVIYNIARAYTVIDNVISEFISKYDLSPAKFNILLMVKHVGKDKGLPQNEISKLLLVTTSNITRMIDKLEKDKYVERVSQKGDRRVNLIKITKKGSDLLDTIWPHYKAKIDSLISSDFTNVDKHKINKLLEQFKGIIKENA